MRCLYEKDYICISDIAKSSNSRAAVVIRNWLHNRNTLDFLATREQIYNLDAIIAVGYRFNSKKATEFRIWATKILKEYMIKGFALNDERFISNRFSTQYFNELKLLE